VALTCSVAVPEVVPEFNVMVVGAMLAVRPDEGCRVSVTVPVKPLRPVTVIVLDPLVTPKGGAMVDGLAVTVKSVTCTVTVRECVGAFGRPEALPLTNTL